MNIQQLISFYLPPVPQMVLAEPKRSIRELLNFGKVRGYAVKCSCDVARVLGHSSSQESAYTMWGEHNRKKHQNASQVRQGDQGTI